MSRTLLGSPTLILAAAAAGSVALHAAFAICLAFAPARPPPAGRGGPSEVVEIGVVTLADPSANPLGADSLAPPPGPAARSANPPRSRPPWPAPARAAAGAELAAAAGAPSTRVDALAEPEPGGAGTAGTVPEAGGETAGPAAPGALARGAGSGGGAPGPLAEIARRLAAAASGCYPRAAARFHAEGTVRLRFCVGPDGRARDASVTQGSGVALLDEAALGCVLDRAAPLPALDRCLALPVRFRLNP